MKRILALFLLSVCVSVGATETEIRADEAVPKGQEKIASEKGADSNSDATIGRRLMNQISDMGQQINALRESIEKYFQENKMLRAENRSLEEELRQSREDISRLAHALGVRNLRSASSAELLSEALSRVGNTSRLTVPPSGLLTEREWRSVEIVLDGADEITEKLRGYESFIKKYQRKNVIIMED